MKYVLIFFLFIETICFAQTNRTVEANKFNMVETVANGKNTISLIPPNLSASYTLTFPVDDGTSNQVLTTDGSGVLSWSSVAASSIAIGNTVTSGTAGSILFVDTGPVLAQDNTNLNWNNSSKILSVVGSFSVDGSSDVVQTNIQGNATQTNDIMVVEKSDGTDLLKVTNTAGTQIKGTTTNTTAASGFVGEVVSSGPTGNVNCPASGDYGDLTSISLTAGAWLVGLGINSRSNGSSTLTEVRYGWSTTSGNSATGLNFTLNAANYVHAYTTTEEVPGSISLTILRLSATTTVYLKYRCSYASGTPQMNGSIFAIRVY